MVAGVAVEPSSLPGKVLSPILSGIDIQNLGNIVKNSSSTKSFVEALSNADPEKVREIIALLEQLAATSLSEKGDLETAVSDAAAALAAAESSLNDANQAVVDADSAVNNAINVVTESNTELSNAQADLAKAQADQVEAEDTKADKETAAATALSDRDTAQTAKDAADKMLEDHGPGYDEEHAIILQVIEMLRNLIEDKGVCDSLDLDYHVIYNNYAYRTLTRLPKDDHSDVCENSWTQMPDGWALSPYAADIVTEVVRPYPWNTDAMHLGVTDGSFHTGGDYSHDNPNWDIDIDGNLYKASVCSLAILIRKSC